MGRTYDKVANVNDTSNATFTVKAAESGKQFTITGAIISTNGSSESVTLKDSDGNTLLGPHYVNAAGFEFYGAQIPVPPDKGITATKSTAGSGMTVTLFYQD